MVLEWQTSDGYPWAVYFQTCRSIGFRSISSSEGGQRVFRRMVVPWVNELLRASWLGPHGSTRSECGWGKGRIPAWFKSMMKVEERCRRMDVLLGYQATEGSVAWPRRFSKQGRWVGRGKQDPELLSKFL